MTEIIKRDTNFRKDAGDVLIRKYFNLKYQDYKNEILLEMKRRSEKLNINDKKFILYKKCLDDVKKETRKEIL